jgi:hypothetical protein
MADFRLLPLDRVFASTNSIVPNDRLQNQGKLSHLRNPFSDRQHSSSPRTKDILLSQRHDGKVSSRDAKVQWCDQRNDPASCPPSARNNSPGPGNEIKSNKDTRPTSATSARAAVKCTKYDCISHCWVEGYRRAIDEEPIRKYLEHRKSNPHPFAPERKDVGRPDKVEYVDPGPPFQCITQASLPKWQVFRAPRAPAFTMPPTRYVHVRIMTRG